VSPYLTSRALLGVEPSEDNEEEEQAGKQDDAEQRQAIKEADWHLFNLLQLQSQSGEHQQGNQRIS